MHNIYIILIVTVIIHLQIGAPAPLEAGQISFFFIRHLLSSAIHSLVFNVHVYRPCHLKTWLTKHLWNEWSEHMTRWRKIPIMHSCDTVCWSTAPSAHNVLLKQNLSATTTTFRNVTQRMRYASHPLAYWSFERLISKSSWLLLQFSVCEMGGGVYKKNPDNFWNRHGLLETCHVTAPMNKKINKWKNYRWAQQNSLQTVSNAWKKYHHKNSLKRRD